tara:strand:- start:51 stop:743 length:693 start_codon:yes stop_codon:yes gene_type:complete
MSCEKEQGFIYKIQSPKGKIYIGQVVEFLNRRHNGKSFKEKKGIRVRWRQHINTAKRGNKEGSVCLGRAILKYGHENMIVTQLMKVDIDKLDLFEEFYIKMYNTLSPNGYNLQKGGTFTKHSKETCEKRSKSIKKLLTSPEKREIWSKAKKGVRQKTKRKCKDPINSGLPKYIYVKRSTPKLKSGIKKEYKGVSVEHPKGKKTFGKTSKYSFNELLEQAKEYIQHLESLP